MAGLLAGVGPGCVLEMEDPPEPGCTDEAHAGLMITVVDEQITIALESIPA